MRRPNPSLLLAVMLTGPMIAFVGAPRVALAQGQPTIALDVTGPNANPGKQQRCNAVAQKAGFALNQSAPVRVTLSLLPGFNRLQITTARRGEVLNQNRPGWGMEQLCQDAIQQAQAALAHELDGPPAPPPQYAPPPPPPQAYTPPPPGSPPTIALDVTGPMSNPGKVQRCLRVAQQKGYVVSASAPVRVMLILQPGTNRLQITSARRGDVLNQPRPGWGMEQLCADAVQTAAQVLAHEGDPAVGPSPPAGVYNGGAPPPRQPPRGAGLALGPIPPTTQLAPNVKAIADGAVAAWQAAQFEASLTAFREAGRILNDPQFLFDQAVCEQHLARYNDALAHTQQFIDRAPQSPYRPYAEQLFTELQASLGMD